MKEDTAGTAGSEIYVHFGNDRHKALSWRKNNVPTYLCRRFLLLITNIEMDQQITVFISQTNQVKRRCALPDECSVFVGALANGSGYQVHFLGGL